MSEARVRINGDSLSPGQVMALRVAVGFLKHKLAGDRLKTASGRMMKQALTEQLGEIQQKMGPYRGF